LEQLKLPDIFKEIPKEKTGLVLVTGATGSGKSTTLAAILNEINTSKAFHIVTLEDPVEYVHPHKKATFNQRELGIDFDSYANGLRAALRQAPKVILVGEMRDQDTVKIAMSAAETGHLVLSTLHTINAGETVNRILGMFDPEEQEQVRVRLADTLRWVVSQRSRQKSAADGSRCWKSWAPICARRKPSASAKAKARRFTKSSRPAIRSAGARLTTPALKPTNRRDHRGNRPALLHQAQRRFARH
jgi:pilus retraction protein PilT